MLLPSLNQILKFGGMTRWRSVVQQIERYGSRLEPLTDLQLHKQSLSLRYRVESGESVEGLLVEAFSLMREAAGRALSMKHYPVQLLGGIAMHHGAVAVMQTGEGKTLTATLPLYLAALHGRGAHLATANDYLAERDAQLMQPAFELLGLSVGVVTGETAAPQRREAYSADITYSTAKEIGFDFLRDRLARRQAGPSYLTIGDGQQLTATVQRDFYFALVDEADSILIDEARTPLIVSSSPDDSENPLAELYRWANHVCQEFEEDKDFEFVPNQRRAELTSSGRRQVRTLPKPRTLSVIPMLDIYEYVERAIMVERFYQRDRHYVVQSEEVQIVDEFTGRIAEGRKWRSGLHQAIEAREGLKISQETGEAARITIQDLFLRYERLAGMTGTVANSGPELKRIYGLRPMDVPTNRPPQRKQLPSRAFATAEEKWRAIADEVVTFHQTGRPILIGTRSIDLSQLLSRHLTEAGIAHQVLNATRIEDEAQIVARAGEVGKVTVATNMAGRGTDIRLTHEALERGGLHVICSELHESARIDRQLIGRCGRQGDPGSFRHFYSLEDDILSAGFDEAFQQRAVQQGQGQNTEMLDTRIFHRAQRRVEGQHFKLRRQLLFHENQRKQMQREMGQDPYLDTIE